MPSHCIESECEKWAMFGLYGGNRLYCKGHAPEGYVDLLNKRCEVTGCQKHASNGPTGGKPQYCGPHGEERGFKNNKCKKCQANNCDRCPNFGPAGGKATHCKEHGEPLGYEDVKNRKCQKPGCKTRANFGPKNGKASHCLKHGAALGYEDVASPRCQHPGCNLHVTYGPVGRKGSHCAEHGKVLGLTRLVHRECQEVGCQTLATYGPDSGSAMYCAEHGKKLGLARLVYKQCEEEGCQTTASYGPEGGRPVFCAQHGKPRGMIEVLSRKCKNGCGTMTSKSRYDGYCVRCYVFTFPDKPVARNWKTKETHFRHHISGLARTEERLKGLQMTFDRALGGCSRRRPDAFIECNSHAIVIECDENQHVDKSSYACENKRMMEIYQDIGLRNLVVIRFNPDKYTDDSGKKVPSCFQYNKQSGIPIPQKKAWKARLDVLTAQILHSVQNIPDKAVTMHHLYYDGFKTPQ